MPFLLQYLIKLFISLAAVYLFYQLILRKLTFYNCNRWYLLGYTLLSFLISFINVAPVLQNNKLGASGIVRLIPPVSLYTGDAGTPAGQSVQAAVPFWNKWDWILFIFCCGASLLLIRLLVRYYSYYRMRLHARLIHGSGMKLYQVDQHIIPFSFGKSIFINRHLHDEKELQEVIRHEFVHVKQRHTHDIIWGELLCIFNWYNPFAWLIRRAIRQNLEFIADNKVLQNGLDKKQYQYLLLKVIGNNSFHIATQFNFSSLKKRIAMMNRMKSARTQLLKFVFVLPLAALLLLAFRNERTHQRIAGQQNPVQPATPSVFNDTVPPILTEKGYWIQIIGDKGNCTVVVKDKNKKEVDRLLLTKWNDNEAYYSGRYGSLVLPPSTPPSPPSPPADATAPRLPKNVSGVQVTNNRAIVKLKNGSLEEYDLDNDSEKAAYEKKYGKLPPAPPPPPSPSAPLTPPAPVVSVGALSGTPAKVGAGVTVVAPVGNVTMTAGGVDAGSMATPVVVGETIVAPGTPVPTIMEAREINIAEGEKILELKIYKNTTRKKLDQFIEQAQAKGVELEFNKISYNDSGKLLSLSGTMKKENLKSTFSVTDFEVVVLSIVKNKDQYFCFVYSNDQKEVI